VLRIGKEEIKAKRYTTKREKERMAVELGMCGGVSVCGCVVWLYIGVLYNELGLLVLCTEQIRYICNPTILTTHKLNRHITLSHPHDAHTHDVYIHTYIHSYSPASRLRPLLHRPRRKPNRRFNANDGRKVAEKGEGV